MYWLKDTHIGNTNIEVMQPNMIPISRLCVLIPELIEQTQPKLLSFQPRILLTQLVERMASHRFIAGSSHTDRPF